MSRNSSAPAHVPRILFLDDDSQRAAAFFCEYPEMSWVKTVEECLNQLDETWDQVHLDHDLGGETLVDGERQDCGMEVVRWLTSQTRTHLSNTLFVIHTHNPTASCMMALHLEVAGYRVITAPFGSNLRPIGLLARLTSSLAHFVNRLRGTG